MSQDPDVQPILDAATQAFASSDWATAEKCLRLALRIQEGALGPSHPELVRTLDRLGSVCEVAHRLGEAELCYRRALSIASATLTPDHPLVTKTRGNLQQFCDAHNLPIEF
jgi:hypothetical protein